MNHCVSTFKNDVEDGTVDVYSLRDPSNNPHITIGMSGNTHSVFEYKGVNNSKPKENYKEMIKEWFISLGDIQNETSDINVAEPYLDSLDEIYDSYNNILKQMKSNENYDNYGFYIDVKEKIKDIESNLGLGTIEFIAQQYVDNNNIYRKQTKIELDNLIAVMLEFLYQLAYSQFIEMKESNKKIYTKLEEEIDAANNVITDLYEEIFSYMDFEDFENESEFQESIEWSVRENANDYHPYYIYQEFLDQFDKNKKIHNLYREIINYKNAYK
jgi:hypothetical protein